MNYAVFILHYTHCPTGSLQNATLLTPEWTILGQSFVLTCEVYSSLAVNTSLLSVQWMHRGNPVSTAGSGFMLKEGSGAAEQGSGAREEGSGVRGWVYVTELSQSETSVEQSGLYSCHVSLDTDRQQVTAEGNLTVACESHLIPTHKYSYIITANLQCPIMMFTLDHLMEPPYHLYWEPAPD